jgi:hypothetical protein
MQTFIEDHLATIVAPLSQILDASGIPYLTLAADNLSERVGAHCAKAHSSSEETDETCNPALPICVFSDCCAD